MGSHEDKADRKLLQLCRQAERRLSMVFAGELNDQLLEGVWIDSVTAPYGSSVLEVTVGLPEDRLTGERRALVLSRLEAASGWLRSEVAAAIHRKRAPRLVFKVQDQW